MKNQFEMNSSLLSLTIPNRKLDLELFKVLAMKINAKVLSISQISLFRVGKNLASRPNLSEFTKQKYCFTFIYVQKYLFWKKNLSPISEYYRHKFQKLVKPDIGGSQ